MDAKKVGAMIVEVEIKGLTDVPNILEKLGEFIVTLYDGLPEDAKLSKDEICELIIKKVDVIGTKLDY